MSDPIVLMGNRMVGIVALVVAAVALVPAADRLGALRWPLALAAAAVGVGVLRRRVELHRGSVRWRTGWQQRHCPTAELVVLEVDHRFLRFRARGRPAVRIEVPAELRPEVRRWAETAGRSTGDTGET